MYVLFLFMLRLLRGWWLVWVCWFWCGCYICLHVNLVVLVLLFVVIARCACFGCLLLVCSYLLGCGSVGCLLCLVAARLVSGVVYGFVA